MLSRSDALDIPEEVTLENQARVRALGITINSFSKTLQGRALIERQEHFILGGKVYQGYNQKALEPSEDQLSDTEIEAAMDVDGTKHVVLATRKRRLDWAAMAKENELGERRRKKIGQRRDELELAKLEREAAEFNGVPTERFASPDPEPTIHICPVCGKEFSSANALQGHKVGAKH